MYEAASVGTPAAGPQAGGCIRDAVRLPDRERGAAATVVEARALRRTIDAVVVPADFYDLAEAGATWTRALGIVDVSSIPKYQNLLVDFLSPKFAVSGVT